jgi:hypothetical protein
MLWECLAPKRKQKLSQAAETEEFVFETPQEVKPAGSKGLWLVIAVIVVAGGIGAYMFLKSKSTASTPAPVAVSSSASVKDAMPIHDLKIQRAVMNKDRTGTMAVWLVTIENKSPVYSYSGIKYETTYVGADNNAVLVNNGTITVTLAPGEQKNSEFTDALYPAGTAWYKLRVTGATPSAE